MALISGWSWALIHPKHSRNAPGALQSILSVYSGPVLLTNGQHLLEWSFALGWDCWSSIHGCYGTWHLLSLYWQ